MFIETIFAVMMGCVEVQNYVVNEMIPEMEETWNYVSVKWEPVYYNGEWTVTMDTTFWN